MTSNVLSIDKNRITPENLLKLHMDECENIESIVIVAKGKDGSCRVGWSNQKVSDLSFSAMTLYSVVEDEMRPRIDV